MHGKQVSDHAPCPAFCIPVISNDAITTGAQGYGQRVFQMIFRYKMFTTRSICICVMFFFQGSASAVEKPYAPEDIPGVTSLSAEEVVDLVLSDPELIIIDSRKKTEYIKGHIEGAINILNTELMPDDL